MCALGEHLNQAKFIINTFGKKMYESVQYLLKKIFLNRKHLQCTTTARSYKIYKMVESNLFIV